MGKRTAENRRYTEKHRAEINKRNNDRYHRLKVATIPVEQQIKDNLSQIKKLYTRYCRTCNKDFKTPERRAKKCYKCRGNPSVKWKTVLKK